MAFPTLTPTGRSYDPGDWPVKKYQALSGAEIRIRYGNKRTNARLTLSYDNVTDGQADSFLTHYLSVEGTFRTFGISPLVFVGTGVQDGVSQVYRYAGPPKVTSIRPNISSVVVELISVV